MNDALCIVRAGPEIIAAYACIPIAFEVRSRLAVHLIDGGIGGASLREEAVDQPYVKDYDAVGDPPSEWAERFDIANWDFVAARLGGKLVGGAALAFECPCGHVAAQEPFSACLWDIRVLPELRGSGVGTLLLSELERLAGERGFGRLHVETQNENVAACRFYRARGFRLVAIDTRAYADLPDEAMLLWEKDLR